MVGTSGSAPFGARMVRFPRPRRTDGRRYTASMRKAAFLLGICIGIGYPIVVTDIDGEKTFVVQTDDTRDSVRVETKIPTGFVATADPNVFETEIDGEKRVIVLVSDTRP